MRAIALPPLASQFCGFLRCEPGPIGLLANDRFSEAIAQAQLAIAEWTPDGGRDAETLWSVLIVAK